MLVDAFGKILADDSIDESFKSLALSLPSEGVVGQEMDVLDPDALHQAREFLLTGVAAAHRDELLANYLQLAAGAAYSNDQRAINQRRLKTTLLGYLSVLNEPKTTQLVAEQFAAADNMTDSQAALALLANLDDPARETALASFYERWRHDALVLDKWFAVQAASQRTDTLEQVTRLTSHGDFTIANPNRVRALLGTFAQNQVRFHHAGGGGYQLLADFVLKIDAGNPQLAARLVSQFNSLRRFDEGRQTHIRGQLQRIAAHDGLSKDVFEIVERALSF